MLHGIGNLHWHRFLLTEACGTIHELDRWEDQLSSSPFVAVTDSKSLFDTITKCRNTSAHIDDKRTAIDLTILKSDLVKTQGQVRWVAGTNMVSDSLTKKMSPWFLRKIMEIGKWSLSEQGYQKLVDIHALFNTKCGGWNSCEHDIQLWTKRFIQWRYLGPSGPIVWGISHVAEKGIVRWCFDWSAIVICRIIIMVHDIIPT